MKETRQPSDVCIHGFVRLRAHVRRILGIVIEKQIAGLDWLLFWINHSDDCVYIIIRKWIEVCRCIKAIYKRRIRNF